MEVPDNASSRRIKMAGSKSQSGSSQDVTNQRLCERYHKQDNKVDRRVGLEIPPTHSVLWSSMSRLICTSPNSNFWSIIIKWKFQSVSSNLFTIIALPNRFN